MIRVAPHVEAVVRVQPLAPGRHHFEGHLIIVSSDRSSCPPARPINGILRIAWDWFIRVPISPPAPAQLLDSVPPRDHRDVVGELMDRRASHLPVRKEQAVDVANGARAGICRPATPRGSGSPWPRRRIPFTDCHQSIGRQCEADRVISITSAGVPFTRSIVCCPRIAWLCFVGKSGSDPAAC